jgi:hypothetical protein
MSCKSLFSSIALCVCMLAATSPADAQGNKKSYEKSAFSNFQSLPANKAAASKFLKPINKEFPGWAATNDKLNGLFNDLYGSPITISGTTNAARSQNCMAQKLGGIGINKNEWKQVSNITAPKADYVNYKQVINGHEVIFSRLSFRFTKSGDLARIQMKNYGAPKANRNPTIAREEAKEIAIRDLNDLIVEHNEIGADWYWFPVPSASGYELRPSWQFEIKCKKNGSAPLILSGYIDAINGDILYRTNKVKETSYDLTVKGVVYKNGTLLPATPEPLENLDLTIGASTYYTDASGFYSNPFLSLPRSTVVSLSGLWSVVIDDPTGITPQFTDLVGTPGSTYTYSTLSPCSDRHINAYYHVNRVHDFMKTFFPTFTDLDFPLPTKVDLTSGTCNAYYTGTDINFFAAGGGCNSFAELGDVVYHEYGHGISDHFYTYITGGSIFNSALNEACSDIWALSITRSPILAQNAFVPYGGFIRRYDLTPQVYPIDLDLGLSGFPDPHKNGEIIAGTWWDVGVNIGSIDTMTQLFTDVYYDAPDGPDGTEGAVYQSILIDVLLSDDDNSNLFDGTPHYAKIVAAFAKHGIYLEQDAYLTHADMPIQAPGSPITVTASLSIGSIAYFHDMTLYYRVNGAGAWTPVTMTNSSFTFTGNIPSQTTGTVVEYYFVVHDGLNIPNAYFPITCNPSLPANQATITYQFGVGIHPVTGDHFEAAPAAGWSIAGNTGDNATSGLWQWGAPTGWFPTRPTGDHTTGSGMCLTTGDGLADTGVHGGTTTVLSPVFDISGYTTPVVEYYRWFTNEQGLRNFKNDPWIVKIRDASGTSWQTVENTYQADVAWRRRMFPVKEYFPTVPAKIQLRFFASDSILSNWGNNGQGTTMAGIDDVFIYDLGMPLTTQAVPLAKAEIYPNPADDRIQIVLPAGNKGCVSLYDVLGKKVKDIKVEESTTNYSMHTNDLAAGTYNLILQTDKSIQTKEIVVVHN